MVVADYQRDSDSLLHAILSNPKLLRSFEAFLRHTWSHENLLFIEAMSQLRHEEVVSNVEIALHRIYNTFLAPESPLELNVTTQNQVKKDIDSLQWAIIGRNEAIAVLEQTEREVLAMLKGKLNEFMSTRGSYIDHTVTNSDPCKHQIRVLIIGGGFTGFAVASILDPMPLFHVTLIDTKDSFEYTPGIVKRIVNPEESSSLRVRHDAYVRNGKVVIGYVDDITDDAQRVIVSGNSIYFDYLVIATGSSYSSQLKSMDVSSLYRLSGLEQVNAELLKARRVLVIGGGLVGCELAAEIAQRKFPGEYPRKHVTLVESHATVTHRSEPHQQEKALEYLLDLGIEVVCNERIVDHAMPDRKTYLGSSGRVYSNYDKVFIATGTRPNSQLLSRSTNDPPLDVCLDDWGRIRVKPTLQLDHWKYKHIFAGGDVTNVVEEKTGYAATLAGVCIARNICRLVKGKSPLRQGTKGTMPAPDKPLHGIASQGGIGKMKLTGFKKKFAFLNPSWAALKAFDEQQYLRMVQGESLISSQVLGRLPRRLTLPYHYAERQVNDNFPLMALTNKALSEIGFPKTHSVTTDDSSVTDDSKLQYSLPILRMSTSSSSSSIDSSQSSLKDFLYTHVSHNERDHAPERAPTPDYASEPIPEHVPMQSLDLPYHHHYSRHGNRNRMRRRASTSSLSSNVRGMPPPSPAPTPRGSSSLKSRERAELVNTILPYL